MHAYCKIMVYKTIFVASMLLVMLHATAIAAAELKLSDTTPEQPGPFGAPGAHTCRLDLHGYSSAAETSSRMGVASAVLECHPVGPAAAPISIFVDSATVGSFAAKFKGVRLANDSDADCLVDGKAPALLSFCGGSELVLDQPIIQGVVLESPASETDWSPALLFFGGSMSVTVQGGLLQHNKGRPVLQVREKARVDLHGTHIAFNTVVNSSSPVEVADGAQITFAALTSLAHNLAKSAAGGLFVTGNANVVFAPNSSCINNTAAEAMGGCMRLQRNATCLIDSSAVVAGNKANHGAGVSVRGHAVLLARGAIVGNLAVLPGDTGFKNAGGVLALENAHVFMGTGSSLSDNIASGYGGGMAMFDNSTAVIEPGCSCSLNVAVEGGGCAFVSDNASLTMRGFVSSNTAHVVGGGILVAKDGFVNITGCLLNNTALVGGGLCSTENGHAWFGDCATVMHNRAAKLTSGAKSELQSDSSSGPSGGGVAVLGPLATMNISSCVLVANNSADVGAGGLAFLSNTASIGGHRSLADCVRMCSTRKQPPACYEKRWQPASLHAFMASNCQVHKPHAGQVFSDSKSWDSLPGLVVIGNTADMGGGAMVVGYNTAAAITSSMSLIANSTIMCNVAKTSGGGLVVAGNRAVVGLQNLVLSFNRATFGAGMFVSGECNVTCMGDTVISHNLASGGRSYAGGIAVLGALILKDKTVVEQNEAAFYGGGASLEFTASLKVEDQAAVQYNKASTGGGLAFANWIGTSFEAYNVSAAVHDNEAGTARDIYLPPRSFSILLQTSNGGFSLVDDTFVYDVVSRVPRDKGLMPLAVHVASHNSMPEAGALVRITLNDTELLGGFKKTNESGVADFYDLKLRAPTGLYNVTVQPLDWFFTPKPLDLLVRVRQCAPGEVTQGLPDACEPCVAGSFSLNPGNASCDACPDGGVCPGGSTVLPLPGYWHSSKLSPQFHRCPNPLACSLQENNNTTQCADGYTGNLCGSCAEGWGMTTLFRCQRCLPAPVIVGLYVAACLVMLAVVQLLAHFTLVQNIKAAQTGQGAGQQLGLSSTANSSLEAADVLKSLVMFAQYLTIIANMKIPWPKTLSYPLKALQWLWSSASSETLAMECVLRHGVLAQHLPVSIQRFLLHLCAPLALYLVLVLVKLQVVPGIRKLCRMNCCGVPTYGQGWHMLSKYCSCTRNPNVGLTRGSHGVKLSSKCVCAVLAMVTLFTFLPSLSTSALGMLVCRKIDDPFSPLPYRHTAAANGSFFAYDLQQQCAQGYHRAWLALVVPCALLLCVVLPASIALLMWHKRRQLDDPDTCYTFGFLYRMYTPSMCGWEAVAVVQTNVLVAVAVWGLSLGGFYQALVMNVALAVMVVLLLVFQPYRCQQLYRLRLIGVQLLLLTSYASLSFIDITYQNMHVDLGAYSMAMGAIVLTINAVYVLYCIGLFCYSTKWLPLAT